MSAPTRHERILEILIEGREATVAKLSEALSVSGKTIREDLEKLEQQGLVKRFHGGARLANESFAGLFPNVLPNSHNTDFKTMVARKALDYIRPGEVVALDGGSTTLSIAKLMDNMPVTVLTNDLFIISELVQKDQIRLVVPGGYRSRNQLVGGNFESFIENMNIQKAFISTTGIHPDYGFTVFTQALVSQKRALLNTAAQTFCVADHTKLGKCALLTFAKLHEMDHIITDPMVADEAISTYSATGIQLIR